MQCALLLGAVALLSGSIVAHVLQGRDLRPDPQSSGWAHPVTARGRPEIHFNGTVNATSPAGTGTGGAPSSSAFSLPHNITSSKSSFHPSGCPQSVTTSTTTVDVTFYITATTSHWSHYSSSSLATGGSPATTTSVPVWHNTTSAAPSQTTKTCDDDLSSSSLFNSTALWSTKTSKSRAQETSTSGATATYTIATSNIPHVNLTTTTYILSTKTQNGTFSQTAPVISSSTTECEDETTASAASTDVSSSAYTVSSSWTTRTPIVTPFHSNTSSNAYSTQMTTIMTTPANPSSSPILTDSCVIDTSMVPVTSAPLTSVPTSTLIPTKTVCQEDAPTGKPKPGNNHCGVHGLPVGNYFLARFVENAPAVPVTLEGCYQFCASVMDATNGCRAYRFYPERGLNVPRCDLYGSSVAYALDSIDNDHPDIWFDLACGSPSDDKWAHLPGITRLRELDC
ncbi:uncharacterized protein ColSpa_08560 [Colletotrichum spaethianum]|uniref:Apple domain-containing protein n=1 Tax=Colletotrichum spaethianum TaxID=700344 RepID=A0AA37PA12_9PEZI|nr:uncharacterized protein ColSpa_08560 [Colletotrichum spaethianum]GKT48379.1 hypothetical protein ColSpa_08560 [Colletotrichum spaethianum]